MLSFGCKVNTYAAEDDLPRGWYLQLLRPGEQDLFIQLGEMTMLGRDLCGLQLVDYHHAVLRRKISNNKECFIIQDNCSRNGTFVNDVKVLEEELKVLRNNDVISLGQRHGNCKFVFKLHARASARVLAGNSICRVVNVTEKFDSQDTLESQDNSQGIQEISLDNFSMECNPPDSLLCVESKSLCAKVNSTSNKKGQNSCNRQPSECPSFNSDETIASGIHVTHQSPFKRKHRKRILRSPISDCSSDEESTDKENKNVHNVSVTIDVVSDDKLREDCQSPSLLDPLDYYTRSACEPMGNVGYKSPSMLDLQTGSSDQGLCKRTNENNHRLIGNKDYDSPSLLDPRQSSSPQEIQKPTSHSKNDELTFQSENQNTEKCTDTLQNSDSWSDAESDSDIICVYDSQVPLIKDYHQVVKGTTIVNSDNISIGKQGSVSPQPAKKTNPTTVSKQIHELPPTHNINNKPIKSEHSSKANSSLSTANKIAVHQDPYSLSSHTSNSMVESADKSITNTHKEALQLVNIKEAISELATLIADDSSDLLRNFNNPETSVFTKLKRLPEIDVSSVTQNSKQMSVETSSTPHSQNKIGKTNCSNPDCMIIDVKSPSPDKSVSITPNTVSKNLENFILHNFRNSHETSVSTKIDVNVINSPEKNIASTLQNNVREETIPVKTKQVPKEDFPVSCTPLSQVATGCLQKKTPEKTSRSDWDCMIIDLSSPPRIPSATVRTLKRNINKLSRKRKLMEVSDSNILQDVSPKKAQSDSSVCKMTLIVTDKEEVKKKGIGEKFNDVSIETGHIEQSKLASVECVTVPIVTNEEPVLKKGTNVKTDSSCKEHSLLTRVECNTVPDQNAVKLPVKIQNVTLQKSGSTMVSNNKELLDKPTLDFPEAKHQYSTVSIVVEKCATVPDISTVKQTVLIPQAGVGFNNMAPSTSKNSGSDKTLKHKQTKKKSSSKTSRKNSNKKKEMLLKKEFGIDLSKKSASYRKRWLGMCTSKKKKEARIDR